MVNKPLYSLALAAVVSLAASAAATPSLAHSAPPTARPPEPPGVATPWADTRSVFSDGLRVPVTKAGPTAADGKAVGRIVLVELSHPKMGAEPLTARQAEEIILGPVQDFFDLNVPGSVTFSIERKTSYSLPFSPCGQEMQGADVVRSKLSIPADVKLIMLTSYSDKESCWYGGLGTVSQPDTAGFIYHTFSPKDSKDGIPGWAAYTAAEVMIHEMGHNFSLPHTERYVCKGGSTAFDASSCYEYLGHSVHDVMGYGGFSSEPLAAYSRWDLGSLEPTHVLHPSDSAGQAWLVHAEGSTASRAMPAPRNGVPSTYLLRLDDKAGRYWVEFRDTYGSAGQPWSPWGQIVPGAVVFMYSTNKPKVEMSPWAELTKPIQVDAYPTREWNPDGSPGNESLDSWADTIPPGKSWTSPGGTTVTVQESDGEAIRVTWSGPGDTTPPDRAASAPEVYTYGGTRVSTARPAPASSLRVLPPLLAVDSGTGTQSCTLKGAPGVPALFQAQSVQPRPSAAWWDERKAKSVTSGRMLRVMGGSMFLSEPAAIKPAGSGYGKGSAAMLSLKPGTYSLSWVCQDRAGNVSRPSAVSKVTITR